MEYGLGAGQITPMAGDVSFVEVIFAKSVDEAEDHRTILEGRAIPAFVEPAPVEPSRSGVAVLVPSDRLVEASEALTMNAHDDIENDSNILDNPGIDGLGEDTVIEPLIEDDDHDVDLVDEDRESVDSEDNTLYREDDDDF